MDNSVTITKQGFFDDIPEENPISNLFGTSPEVSYSFLNTYKLVRLILDEELPEGNYVLNFPEKFMPNNVSQHFWELVKELLHGEMHFFTVRTSDLISVGFINPSKAFNSEAAHSNGRGWDVRVVECPEEDGINTYGIGSVYGHDISRILTSHKF